MITVAVTLGVLGWVVAAVLFLRPAQRPPVKSRPAAESIVEPADSAKVAARAAREQALIKIYRRAHDPKQTSALIRSGKYLDALRAADLAEKALRLENPWALAREKERERLAAENAESGELEQLIANED